MNLNFRQLEPELMDDPELDANAHQQALNGLARTHVFTRTARRIWSEIVAAIPPGERRTISILDVGCGDGFLLRQIEQLAIQAGYSATLHGCDFSRTALELARTASEKHNTSIEFHQLDILRDELPPVEIIINSLFLHHFQESQVVDILRKFDSSAAELVVVQDLARTRLGYGLCLLGTRLLSRSRIVHIDGLLSVKAAFSAAEFRQMLLAAGITHAKVTKHWPERFTIVWPTHQELLQ
ncbi:methyltransferase domain-containing protein [Aureliella helgolandensis]|uniref:Methyltransferase domain-containing protein n=1 Tax=Aureliella helgolandensis TaxID=2527968 RepID=A0A518G8M7_9BACT|nr:methyltransferase domain-containing protein [Aureliella helgolandensis]QDV24943.1 hypothetical protein Q31a_32650 [Aureliella helgolandensis]